MNMKISPNDVSNHEILEALNAFASSVDNRFDCLETRMDKIELRLTKVETTMVTKGYLDDKLADLKSDLMHYTDKQIEKAIR
jgi:hypothetical protein